ncbi:glycosyltransferase [Planctomicrobium piriforme]|uniref:Glycosyltransferase involved in cell wall bisynthesis n=1 Tax=Planctomicrobium piriforme TaxID=1576369 RepID=A0A1I3MRB3_9PLAN|nr:glycosyltransferase [Planctomicrobium piriforme]SFI99255.1 Glycosyltransferase involved in cell wall bisynthesis [Planctomicrobium piriforme]
MPSISPLTLIVPVFNEHENFPRLVEQVEQTLHIPYRMLVVYDFDEDSTVPVARELAVTRPWLMLVRNDLGRGPANAIRAGFQAAQSGPALVVMADLSDDLAKIPQMLTLYEAGYQVVCASRYMLGGKQIGGPLLKRIMSQTAGVSLYWLAGFPTHDATNNFRLYDAALVNEMGIESAKGFEIALELTAKAYAQGEPVAEIPAMWRDRTAGTSNFQIRKWLPFYLKWYRYAFSASLKRRLGIVRAKPLTPRQ